MEEYILDFIDVETKEEIHELISNTMSFPDYYGKNLDALWDILTDYYGNKKITVIIKNVDKCHSKIAEYLKEVVNLFYEVHEELNSLQVVLG